MSGSALAGPVRSAGPAGMRHFATLCDTFGAMPEAPPVPWGGDATLCDTLRHCDKNPGFSLIFGRDGMRKVHAGKRFGRGAGCDSDATVRRKSRGRLTVILRGERPGAPGAP